MARGKPEPKLEFWPIDKLTPYGGNPRVISEEAVEKVAASIKAFGFNAPIVVTTSGEIAAGHTRLRAAERLELARVPVVVVDLTPEQLTAYRIADNKTAEFSGWDFGLLRIEIDELMSIEDFDITATGFDQVEIDKLLNDAMPPSLDDLEGEYGDYDPVDGWPIVRLKLSPEVKDRLDSAMTKTGRETDSEKIGRILECVDVAALGGKNG